MSKNKENVLILVKKKAIDEAFESTAQYGTKSHETVMEETKKKYPDLFQR